MKLEKVRIRMYKVGLGDCFLLSLFTKSDKTHHILIDFGVLLGTNDAKEKMTIIAKDIIKETGNHLDTLVITHEHWDHLSGFHQAKDVFDQLEVGELWLAWTENPDNKLAQELRKAREEKKSGLAKALTQIEQKMSDEVNLSEKQMNAQLSFLGAVKEVFSFNGKLEANGKFSTANVFDNVKQRVYPNIQYCIPGDGPIPIKDMEGIRVYILGPPLDEKLIKKDFAKKEVYSKLNMTESGTGFFNASDIKQSDQEDKYMPFANVYQTRYNEPSNQLSEYELLDKYLHKEDWRKIENDWLNYAGPLALALDSDTNNTSLVLAFELTDSGNFLLFPGDAQVGNWLSWYNYKWSVKNSCNETEIIDIKKIFERTVFYKVGHHGSHNATLKDKGLEMMSNEDLTMMIPVDRSKAKEKEWEMPFPPLFDSIYEKSRGRILLADESFNENNKPSTLSSDQWDRFKKMVSQSQNDLYIDLEIKC